MKNFLFNSRENLSLFNVKNDYVLFDIGEETFAIKLLDIKEIVANRNIAAIDDLPPHISGLTNIRGIIFPVFDLKIFFNFENSKKYGKYSVIIILEDSVENISLLADSILDIYNIPDEKFRSCPVGSQETCNFIDYEIDLNNKIVKVINAEKILNLKILT